MKRRTPSQLRAATYRAPLAPGWRGWASDPRMPAHVLPRDEPDIEMPTGRLRDRLIAYLNIVSARGLSLPYLPDLARLLNCQYNNLRQMLRTLEAEGVVAVTILPARGSIPGEWCVEIAASGVVVRSAGFGK